jgi:23S rRNA U2552 (ribose-2'-O)-methylase RlmE/FtsJ
MVYHEPLVSQLDPLHCFFICEAPGGFIESLSDIRRKKNLRLRYLSVSKYDQCIKYDRYLEESQLMYSDVTNPENILQIITKVVSQFPNKLDFITADGGFDIKNFNAQEIISAKLLLCEMYLGLSTQKCGGMFVIKFFDMFTHNSVVYYLILCAHYKYVKIIKPCTSRNCNSERYLICYDFLGCSEKMLKCLWHCILHFKSEQNTTTVLFPNINLPDLSKLTTFNNVMVYEQIKTIKESIKMVHHKDHYFQNMLLNIFLERKYKKSALIYDSITIFKNILQTRIKKCTDFLRKYNININQIVYQLSKMN